MVVPRLSLIQILYLALIRASDFIVDLIKAALLRKNKDEITANHYRNNAIKEEVTSQNACPIPYLSYRSLTTLTMHI